MLAYRKDVDVRPHRQRNLPPLFSSSRPGMKSHLSLTPPAVAEKRVFSTDGILLATMERIRHVKTTEVTGVVNTCEMSRV